MPSRALVIANILVRAVLGKRVREVFEASAEDVPFFVPEFAYAEAEEHLAALVTKRGGDPEKALAVLSSLGRLVELIGSEVYGKFEVEARERLARRDPEDWPILAAALALGCPIWTEDTDFFLLWCCHVDIRPRADVPARVRSHLEQRSEISRDAKTPNLIGSELVRLAACGDLDKSGGDPRTQPRGNGGSSRTSCLVAVEHEDTFLEVLFKKALLVRRE
jgi:PIN domain